MFHRSYNWELYLLNLAQAAAMRYLVSVSRSALSLIAPQKYTNLIVYLYLCPIASSRSVFDGVLGWNHGCMALILFFESQSEILICDKYNVYHPGKLTRRYRHHPRTVCIQQPPHRSSKHFQCHLLPGPVILILWRIIKVDYVRNDQRGPPRTSAEPLC